MSKPKIIIVEDEIIPAITAQETLEHFGYEVSTIVMSGEKALKEIEKDRPDLALMDISLRGNMDGIETAEIIRSRFNIPVIYITAYTGGGQLERLKISEPFGIYCKTFSRQRTQECG